MDTFQRHLWTRTDEGLVTDNVSQIVGRETIDDVQVSVFTCVDISTIASCLRTNGGEQVGGRG